MQQVLPPQVDILGGSWKKLRPQSKNGKRSLHGKEGGGRFRAFAIGSMVEWTSNARRADGSLERTRVTGSMDSSEFAVSDPEELATGEPGTEVRITRPREHANRLLGETAVPWLVTQFAVYLVKYPGLTITYEGTTLDPATIVARDTEIELDAALGGDYGRPSCASWSGLPTLGPSPRRSSSATKTVSPSTRSPTR